MQPFSIVKEGRHAAMNDAQTIAAIATAYGESGIGIVRMSGPEALDIFLGLFRLPDGKALMREEAEPRRMHYGFIRDS